MITTEEMRELEDNSGLSRLSLMNNAGRAISNAIKDRFDIKDKKVLIVCYHGNNGGDGFVAANYLADHCEVDIFFIGDESKFKEETRINYEKVVNNIKVQFFDIAFYDITSIDFDDYDLIVDAMLGTGVKGDINEPLLSVIDKFNSSKATKIAIDVPTGINPDTGEESNKFINFDFLITMHDIKKGLEKYKDKTIIADIGIKKR
jgi:hydroxyethylthiazole kinase-like uncharacterized protein yjeF